MIPFEYLKIGYIYIQICKINIYINDIQLNIIFKQFNFKKHELNAFFCRSMCETQLESKNLLMNLFF